MTQSDNRSKPAPDITPMAVLDVPAQPPAPARRSTLLGTGSTAPNRGAPGNRLPMGGNPYTPGRIRTLLGTGSEAPSLWPSVLDEDSADQISGVRAVEQHAVDQRANEDARTTRPDSVSALRKLAIVEPASPWSQPPPVLDDDPAVEPWSERPTLTQLSIPKLRTAAHVEALFALTVALVVLATAAVLLF